MRAGRVRVTNKIQFGESIDWRSNLSSIFISNLSVEVSRYALWDAFSDYGKVADVFIQRRSRQNGTTSFVFVRYWKEKEVSLALKKAHFLFLEGIPIRVSQARIRQEKKQEFGRKVHTQTKMDGRTFKEVVINAKANTIGDSDHRGNDTSLVANEKTPDQRDRVDPGDKAYKEQGNERTSPSNENMTVLDPNPNQELDFKAEIPSEDMQWLERCMVGKLNPNVILEQIQETVAGLNLNASMSPLSNVRVLFQFQNMEDMQSFLDHPKIKDVVEIPSIIVGKWRRNKVVIKASIDESFLMIGCLSLVSWMDGDDNSNDVCSCSGERTNVMETKALVNGVVINDGSEEMVPETIGMEKNVEGIREDDSAVHGRKRMGECETLGEVFMKSVNDSGPTLNSVGVIGDEKL
ncbi:hypothetical protein COLO4_19923 [Corchorus olitorius]|uniref:RRM domain-containing protein n=1 Tax=Corchorus olitorius TaxID=93759 RepID=A0A1R3J2R1_9ROSI|nr:hypothetical protein COLO4_19923 [Corchorus olitorius]